MCFPIDVSVCVVCSVLVNCFLNAFAICVGEVIVLSLKAIVCFCRLIRVFFQRVCDPSVFPSYVRFVCLYE